MHQFLVTVSDKAMSWIPFSSDTRIAAKEAMAKALKETAGLDRYAEISIDHLGVPINPAQLPEPDEAQSSTG